MHGMQNIGNFKYQVTFFEIELTVRRCMPFSFARIIG